MGIGTQQRGKGLLALLPAVVAGVALSSAVDARQLNFAIGYADGSLGADAANRYADALEEYSGGDLTARVFPRSLLEFDESSTGLRDGTADSSILLLPYFPSEYPSSNLAAELSMLLEVGGESVDKSGLAYGGAMSEFIFHNCPECHDEFRAQNQVFAGSAATSPYYLLCNGEVTTTDDLRGKRMRVGGAQWSRWVREMGASPVSLSQHETYEALSQGAVDCSVHSTPELTIVNLIEVIEDITVDMPGGVFGGVGSNNLNIQTWQSLDGDQREALMRASAVMSAEMSWVYEQGHQENMEKVRDMDRITVHEPDDGLVEDTVAFIEADMERIAENYRDNFGVERADEMIADFREILDKWIDRVQGVDSSDELAQLYWDEVFSRVDLESYGE